MLSRDFDMLCQTLDGEIRIAIQARIQNFQMFLRGYLEPLQRFAKARSRSENK